MNILITGGAGFIGSSLADALLEGGYDVIVLDNFNDYYDVRIKEQNVSGNMSNPHYHLVRGDIENGAEIEKLFDDHKIDIVYHFAARAGVRPSILDPVAYGKTNVIGTMNLLECMRRHGVNRLLFASSSSVYGNCSAEKYSEDLKVSEPISPYAATKLACEQMIYTYTKLYGIKALCFRFFTVYGPRQRPDLAIRKFADKMLKGDVIQMYGDGSSRRDYTFIGDIVAGLLNALKRDDLAYEIINLGGGDPVTLMRMIKAIETALGVVAKIQTCPMQMGDVDKTVCDWSKAYRLLDYTPKMKFEEGVVTFVNWLKETIK